jgi:hypothetical protein
MAQLHLFGGEKGGVGKSFVCRTALQYHEDQGMNLMVFDTDRSNPDVRRIYSHLGCRVAVFSEGEKYEDTANIIYNTAIEQRVLVNLPAQVFTPVKEWFEKNELLDLAIEDGVQFYYWFVCDGGYDSLKLFARSVNFFGGRVPHILVKNEGKCDDWSPLEQDESLQALMAQYGVQVMTFPKFVGNVDRNTIDAQSWTFGEARQTKDFTSISRQRVRSFLRKAYEGFEAVGVFDREIKTVEVVDQRA